MADTDPAPSSLTLPLRPKQVAPNGDAAASVKNADDKIWTSVLNRVDDTGRAISSIFSPSAKERFSSMVSGQANGGLHLLRLPMKQLDFLTELASDMPDHYVCEQCLKLHTIDDETEGFAADVAFVETASHAKKAPKKRHLALELPCQRKDGIRFSASGSSHPLVHNFTGGLSSARRTPLAGILHRDVELTLKRARLLKEMENNAQEDQLVGAFDAAVLSDSSDNDNDSDKNAARTPSSKPKQPANDETKTTVQEVSSHDEDAAEEADAEDSDEEETVVVHASTEEAAAELAEARPSAHWARKSETSTVAGPPPKFRKNGWVAMFTETVASTANSLIPQALRPETAEDKESQAADKQKTREQELKGRRQHLETALAAALSPIKADVSLVKIDRISRSRYPFRETTTAKYTFTPCIKDGRYMLKTTVKIHRQEAKNVALSICPHQLLNHHRSSDDTGTGPDLRLQDTVHKVNEAMRARKLSLRDIYYMGGCDADELDENEYESDNDVPEADKDCKQGMRQRGSCHRCATDFAVRGLSRKNQIMISVWQDLGEETCMADAHWQSHIPGEMLQIEDGVGHGQTTNLWDQGLEVLHLAGGVRALYEGTPITLAPFTYRETEW